jgi:flagellar basal body-associated protein FliL
VSIIIIIIIVVVVIIIIIIITIMAATTTTTTFPPPPPKVAVQTRPKPLDFYARKNPQHAFLRRGSKRICPMSQLCGM